MKVIYTIMLCVLCTGTFAKARENLRTKVGSVEQVRVEYPIVFFVTDHPEILFYKWKLSYRTGYDYDPSYSTYSTDSDGRVSSQELYFQIDFGF
jgi:hypothetical protein